MMKLILLLSLTFGGFSANLCADPKPSFPLAKGRISIRPVDLCRDWTHSSEEEGPAKSEQVFRPANSKEFPPSRFRMQYKFFKNGECELLVLAPNDAHHFQAGKWQVDHKDKSVLRITTGTGTVSFRITTLTPDLLRWTPL